MNRFVKIAIRSAVRLQKSSTLGRFYCGDFFVGRHVKHVLQLVVLLRWFFSGFKLGQQWLLSAQNIKHPIPIGHAIGPYAR